LVEDVGHVVLEVRRKLALRADHGAPHLALELVAADAEIEVVAAELNAAGFEVGRVGIVAITGRRGSLVHRPPSCGQIGVILEQRRVEVVSRLREGVRRRADVLAFGIDPQRGAELEAGQRVGDVTPRIRQVIAEIGLTRRA
jgi:hypothetical protein